ncbi:unnamed protein product [Protopolystoma xenopodis]|uniref:Uncharacterized protein n=1 Tax=Protopolystoma xenopodis TaxID=117903 RepID=A0A448XI42_9PLAT|nr:unnamed protein product [Protopolystoma xenopodis]
MTRDLHTDLPQGPVDLFPIFLIDRFPSFPAPVYVLLQALFDKPLETHTLPLHRAELLGSDYHAYRYQALPSRVVNLD